MQNTVVVVNMTLLVFDQPKADLNCLMPICIGLMTAMVAIPFYLLHFAAYRAVPRYKSVCDTNVKAQLMERSQLDASQKSDPEEDEEEEETLDVKSDTSV